MARIASFLGLTLTGFWGWSIKILVMSGVMDRIILPMVNSAVNWGYMQIDIHDGKVLNKKFEETKDEKDRRDILNRMP